MRQLFIESLRHQLVHLGAVAAVVPYHQHHLHLVTDDGLQLLDVEHQAAIAFDRDVLPLRIARASAYGDANPLTDGAKPVRVLDLHAFRQRCIHADPREEMPGANSEQCPFRQRRPQVPRQ